MTAKPTYDLGPLPGTQWHQYASHVGQLYFIDQATGARSYAIPPGYEDAPNDNWAKDSTKTWPQWSNTRTGRAVLIDPTPVTNTYLDDIGVRAGLTTLERVPESLEHLYRIPMSGILQLAFPRAEGFNVVAETEVETTRPDIIVFKVWCIPLGTLYSYDYLIVECKNSKHTIRGTEPQFFEQLANCNNETKNAYGLIQCGLYIQFYKHENFQFQKMGQKMHIVNDAQGVQQMLGYIKSTPMSL